ncbi:MAG: hypothetical protein U0414_03720 [Polyangiaceae bacterium]
MKPVGGPPSPETPRVARPESTTRVEGTARAEERAAMRSPAASKTEPRRGEDLYTRRSDASTPRPASFDAAKVARLRELADRGACVPSPERIAAALSQTCAPSCASEESPSRASSRAGALEPLRAREHRGSPVTTSAKKAAVESAPAPARESSAGKPPEKGAPPAPSSKSPEGATQ